MAAGAIQQETLMEFAGLYRRVGLPVPHSFMMDPDNMGPPPDREGFDLSEHLETLSRDVGRGAERNSIPSQEREIRSKTSARKCCFANVRSFAW